MAQSILLLSLNSICFKASGKQLIKKLSYQFKVGPRSIIIGPNGAGKSTLLKALSGALPLAAGSRREDDRLRLGVFAQDLAQDLPQEELALSYVATSVRQFDPTITEERCRSIMGSLGLVGDKSIRPIGSLSGGEKARVANTVAMVARARNALSRIASVIEMRSSRQS